MNILIVDDDAITRKVARAALVAEGFATFEADDGLAALAVLERESIDGIVSDIMMPRMDGYRLCSEVRASPKSFRALPFVFYTANYTAAGDEKLALDIGADKFLRKGQTPMAIIQALREAMAAPRRQPSAVEPPQEVALMKEYNERLVVKLEQKNEELTARAKALSESESYKRAILESALDCIVAMDHRGQVIEFNPAAENVFGYTRAEAMGREMAGLIIPPAQRERHRQGLARLLAGGADEILGRRREMTAMRKGGEEFPVELTITRMAGVDPLMFTGFIRDLTERKRAEQSLRAAENKFRQLVEQSLVGIYIIQDGRFVYVNPKMTEIFGWSGAELMAVPVLDLAVPEDRELVRENLRKRIDGLVLSLRYEVRIRHQRGAIRQVEVHGTRIEFEGRSAVAGMMLDITERQQGEQALATAEAKFRNLVEQSLVGIYVVQGDYFVYANPKMAEILGRSEQEITSLPLSQLIYEQDWPLVRENVRQRLSGEVESVHYTLRMVRRDGTIIDVEARGARMEYGGQPAIMGTLLDITEQKRAQARIVALANLGQKLSATKTAKEAGQVIVEVADQLFGWDCCSLDLYSPETNRVQRVLNLDLINGQRTDCPLPYEDAELPPRVQRVVSEGAQLILRLAPLAMPPDSIPFGDTSRPSASIMSVPIRNGAKVIGILSIHSYQSLAYNQQDLDVLQSLADHCGGTLERIRNREALQHSEERFRQLAENINEVFWMTDVAKTRMLYVSPAYEGIWGRTCESLYRTPSTWLEAIHADDRARVAEGALTRQARGEYNEVYRIARPDGTIRWIHDRAFPIRNDQGEVYRVVGTAEDITGQRSLEAQLRQAQKMEAIGTLAGGIAHDFNNILAAINGFAELAKLDAANNPTVLEYLNEVSRAGWRATDLVRQILTFSRQTEQQRKHLQLRHIVAEAFKLLRATIPSSIEFNLSLSSDVPLVLADATQVHQIAMNLGTNAAHAMRSRAGRIEVKLSKLAVDSDMVAANPSLRVGLYALLSISDTGHGMPRDVMERIFEPFFTTKKPGEGTGLGLSVVHGIMQAHEGCITVCSQPGQGTTFHLYFPAAAGEESPVSSPVAEIPRGQGQRILLVDDEPALVMLGEKTLIRLGYTVESTTNPREALDRVRQEPDRFALIVTDLTMPNLTGVDLARELLRLRPGLPIILTTGYSANLTSESVKAMGIRAMLSKPLSRESLGEAIHRVLKYREHQS